MAVKLVIEPIFEADFQDSSYGFRPGRDAHQAMDDGEPAAAVQEHAGHRRGHLEVFRHDPAR